MEIKPQEIRLGNLIKIAGVVQAVTSFEFLRGHKTLVNEFVVDACSPIELTPEWLERFGFEKIDLPDNEGHYYQMKLRNGGYLLEGDRGGVCSCFVDGHTDWRVFKVHQLQNIFYSLTGEELAIDKTSLKN